METIADIIKFLKSNQSFQRRKARDLAKNRPDAANKHKASAEKFDQVISWFESHSEHDATKIAAIGSDSDDLFSLNPLDMKDLPSELSEELNVSQSDTEDAQILELMTLAGRALDLNELLIGCFRKYNTKHKRNHLTARIYRLIKRNLVHNVGKGKYALGVAPVEESIDMETYR